MGRELGEGHRYRPHMPHNLWPSEAPAFRQDVYALYQALDALGLGFCNRSRCFWICRRIFPRHGEGRQFGAAALHYPPTPPNPEGVRAGAYEDINVITLLLGAEEAGLQLMTREGAWLDVNPPEGAIVVNIGDMLERLTNHKLPSTTHRVVNPAANRAHLPRYSIPFFLHFAPDYLIRTLPACVDGKHPDRYPQPITAQDFLYERLRETGWLKPAKSARPSSVRERPELIGERGVNRPGANACEGFIIGRNRRGDVAIFAIDPPLPSSWALAAHQMLVAAPWLGDLARIDIAVRVDPAHGALFFLGHVAL